MKATINHTFYFVAIVGFAWSAFAAPTADLNTPQLRRPAVETAESLARRLHAAPLPTELTNPFNPPAFGQPDPEELRALAAARAAAAAANVQAKPATDQDLLKLLAQRIAPSGTMMLGNESLLIFGSKRLRVGDMISVSYEGVDYKLEVAAIEAVTFTLRFNRAEITRRIHPGTNQ
jgi:hypothetical protein